MPSSSYANVSTPATFDGDTVRWVDLDLDGWPVQVLRFALTFALAELSYRFVEQPIRSGRRIINRQRILVPAVAMVAVAARLGIDGSGTAKCLATAVAISTESFSAARKSSSCLASMRRVAATEGTERAA